MKCYDEAEAHNKPCKACDCKHWIDYKQEQNCSVLSIRYNGAMTLQQIAERLGVSHVRTPDPSLHETAAGSSVGVAPDVRKTEIGRLPEGEPVEQPESETVAGPERNDRVRPELGDHLLPVQKGYTMDRDDLIC